MNLEENYIFNCSTNSLQHISAVLNGLPTSITKLHFVANSEGISFVAEEDKVTLIEVFFEKSLFTSYSLNEDYDEIRITLDAKSLMESLNIASKETNQISIFLSGMGDDLVLIYQDAKIVEKCQLHTYVDNNLAQNTNLEIGDESEWEISINEGALFFDFLKDFKDLLCVNTYLCLNDNNDLYLVGLSESSSTIVYKLPASFIDVLNKEDDVIHLKNTQIFKVLKMFKSISKIKIIKSNHLIKFQIFSNQFINSLSSYKDTLINITMMRSEHEFSKNTIYRAISLENEAETLLPDQEANQPNYNGGMHYDDTTFTNTVPFSSNHQRTQTGARSHNAVEDNTNYGNDDDLDVPAFL